MKDEKIAQSTDGSDSLPKLGFTSNRLLMECREEIEDGERSLDEVIGTLQRRFEVASWQPDPSDARGIRDVIVHLRSDELAARGIKTTDAEIAGATVEDPGVVMRNQDARILMESSGESGDAGETDTVMMNQNARILMEPGGERRS